MRTLLGSATPGAQNRQLAQDLAWSWVRSKWPRLAPPAPLLGRHQFHSSAPGKALAVDTSGDGKTWTLEVAVAERDSERAWITKVVIADAGATDLFGIETRCTQQPGAGIVAPPALLGAWTQRLRLVDGGVELHGEPAPVDDEPAFQAFCSHLLSRERRLPVVVLANKPHSRYYGTDPRGVAEMARGIAHVACLAPEAAAEFAHRFGRPRAPVPGAVRVYLPGFQDSGDSREHPLIVPPAGEPQPGAAPFRRVLRQRLCELSVLAVPAGRWFA
ncbi:MAG TPA: hypothetical protein VEA40_12275 [Ramlibacter sp.]|nr:hypothetical protein [Ramlibacter sp.]